MSSTWVVVLVAFSLGQIVSAGHCGENCKIDLCLVADESGSVTDFDDIKDFMDKLVRTMVVGPNDIQVGLVKFDGQGTLVFDLDARDTQQKVLNGINAMQPSQGSTRISAGINTTTDECFGAGNGERDGVKNIMLVVTDGKSTVLPDNLAAAVTKAKAADITILVVGVDNPDVGNINIIGDFVAKNIFFTNPPGAYNFDTLVPAVNKRIRDFCHVCELDLCLVVDESGSISIFSQVKGFLMNLMDQLDIGPAAIQVGLVTFNGDGHLKFRLDKYDDKTGVIGGINIVVPSSLNTDLSSGIDTARIDCFGAANGDRDGIPNVMLMVTDGKSTVPIDKYKEAANAARDEGIEIIVVGVKNPDVSAIDDIAGGIKANIFDADDTDPTATYDYTTIVPALKNRLTMLCNICELDICLVVDQSGSVLVFAQVKAFLMDLMDTFDIGISAIRVGLVTFDGTGHSVFHLDEKTTKYDVIAGISGITNSQGTTHVSSGINTATNECFNPCYGDRKSAPNLMLMVTDAKSTVHPDPIATAASDARDAGITIIGIGVQNPDVTNMNIIVNNLQANLFLTNPPGTHDFMTLVPAVGNHLLSFCLICRVDVCFVLDESGSISVFNAVKQFVKDFVHVMNVGSTGTRVGVVTFNQTGTLRFDLNDYFKKSEVLAAVEAIQPGAGFTKISSGIERANTGCFNGAASGDREDAQNVMYVITDGTSTVTPDDISGAVDAAMGGGIGVIGIGVETPNMGVISLIAGGIPDHTFNADNYNSGTPVNPDYTPLVPAMEANYHTFCHSLCLADVCFVIDESGSGNLNSWNKVLDFMKNFVNTQTIGPFGTQVGVVEFDSTGNPTFDLVEHLTPAALEAGINAMVKSQGGTSIAAGIYSGISYCFGAGQGSRSNARHVMIVATDGWNNAGAPSPKVAADAARAAGIEVLAIGFNPTSGGPNMAMINDIAGQTDYAFNAGINNFATIDGEIAEIYEVLCHTMCRFDICFVLDESGSVLQQHHARAKESMISFVSAIDIGYQDNLVGGVQFNGAASTQFDLNTHLTHPPMIGAIAAFPFSWGTTDIGDGIDLARDFCFHAADSGNRKFAHNVMYVMTDGGAQDKVAAEAAADVTWFEGTDIVVMGVKTKDHDADVLEHLAGNIPENNFLAELYVPQNWNPVTTGIIKWYYKNAQYQ